MRVEQIPYLMPYILSAFVSLGIGFYAWQHRRVTGVAYYAAIAFSQGLTTLAYIFEITSDRLEIKSFWDDAQWLTLSVTAVSVLVFALHYSVKPPSRPIRQWIYLAIVPGLFMLLVLTNRWHDLTRTDATVVPGDMFSALQYPFSLLSTLVSAYLLVLGFSALVVLTWRYFQIGRLYRAQLVTIILGVALPTFGGLAAVLGLTLSFQRDLSPIAFAIGNLIVAWGLFRYRLLDVAPIAREVVMENMTDAVLVLDHLDRIVDINPAGRKLFGRLGYVASLTAMSVERVLTIWPDLMKDQLLNQSLQAEFALETLDGDILTFDATVSPIPTGDERLCGRVVVLKDVTDRKQMQEDLVKALDRAEESDRIKSLFLASVSHELRTPLNAIINFNQFVSSGLYGPVNDQQRDSLVKSTDSARHLLALINDVLDISKIEAGHEVELFIEDDVDIAAEIKEVATVARALLENKPVEIALALADNLPQLSGDKRRIRQILFNLAANAAKFTEAGTIKLRAWSNDDKITVAVDDTGPGIPFEEQSMIFEPFYQLEPVQGTAASGTGLGLPISRSLAEAHGGRLTLESIVGRGSSFLLELPLKAEDKGWLSTL